MVRDQLAILIPAYNEAATIAKVVARACAFGDVIVFDNDSSDGTAEIARRAGAEVHINKEKGYESNLNALFALALSENYTYAVTIDADGEHDPAVLSEVRSLFLENGALAVFGIRPSPQRFSEKIVCWLARRKYGIDDVLCGLKGYDLRLVSALGNYDSTRGVGMELAVRIAQVGIPFRQVHVRGEERVGAPRFAGRIRADLRIFSAFARLVRIATNAKAQSSLKRLRSVLD